MNSLSVCLYSLNRSLDPIRAALEKQFPTFVVRSEKELHSLLKRYHIFCIVIGCNVREDRDLLAIRTMCSALPRIPYVVYGRVNDPEFHLQLGKYGIEKCVAYEKRERLLQILLEFKAQAAFRVDLRDFGIDVDQCKSYWCRKFFDFILKDYNLLKYRICG